MKEHSNFFRQRVTPVLFILLCSLITALNATNNPFRVGNTAADSSVFTYVAKVIVNGGMPYRDTFDHKGPLIYLIDACGLLISRQYGVWVLELVSIFCILLIAYKLSKLLSCGRISAYLVVLMTSVGFLYYFDGGNITEEYACIFIALALYIFVKFFRTDHAGNAELTLCGASFAAVFFLRANMVALWVVMCIGVLVHCLRNKKERELPRFVLWFVFGVLIVTVPLMMWLIRNNSFHDFVDAYFKFNVLYSTNNERASITQKISTFAFFCSEAIAVITIPILVGFSLKEHNISDVLCLVSTVFSLTVMSMSGQKYLHYGLILIPLFTYSIARVLSVTEKAHLSERPSACPYVVASLCLVILLFAHTFVEISAAMIPVIKRSGVSMTDKRVADLILSNTDPEDKISVCGNHNILYLLSDRDSASVYSYQTPIANIDPSIKNRYLEDMKSLKAKMIIMTKQGFLYDELTETLNDHYTLLETVSSSEVYLLNLDP